jgi:hypothetical protein
MWFDMTSDRIWEVLSKDQRLSRDTLIQLDTNRLKASFR